MNALTKDFPILSRDIRGKRLVYLDNGASSQKPASVIEAMDVYDRRHNANIHRGVYLLSQEATALYDEARTKARVFLNAAEDAEIVFTKGCTEAINLVASSLSRSLLGPGDTVLVTVMEHHSNIVPWQLAAEVAGAQVKVVPMSDEGVLDLDAYGRLLEEGNVRIVAVTHVSNVLGTVNPIQQMGVMAHRHGALMLVDGAQAAPHHLVDVQNLDADFYSVAGHKMFAPMGVGLLYGKRKLLEALPPYQGGGDMIRTVSFEKTTYAPLPMKFEAGTPNVMAACGFAAAVDYLASLGDGEDTRGRLASAFAKIETHEQELLKAASEHLGGIATLRIVGEAPGKSAIVSFTLENAHPHDVATVLDNDGIAIRAGHHCCMPLMKRLGVPATARASFALYNELEDVAALAASVRRVVELFA